MRSQRSQVTRRGRPQTGCQSITGQNHTFRPESVAVAMPPLKCSDVAVAGSKVCFLHRAH